MRNFFILLVSFIWVFVGTICFGDEDHFLFERAKPGMKTGTITGVVKTGASTCVVYAVERGQVYGKWMFVKPGDRFVMSDLPPGTYDIVVEPVEGGYAVLVGQYIPEEYRGDGLFSSDTAALRDLIENLIPKAYEQAYLQSKDMSGLVAGVSPRFEDRITSAPRGYGRSFSMNKPNYPWPVIRHLENRTILFLVGNSEKAAAICLVKEERTFAFFERGHYSEKEKRIIKERIHEEKTYEREYLDLCLFEKNGHQWEIVRRELLKPRIFPLPNVADNVKKLQLIFQTEAPLVGVQVKPNKSTDIGTIIIEKWNKN